jgi:hypothetical protein
MMPDRGRVRRGSGSAGGAGARRAVACPTAAPRALAGGLDVGRRPQNPAGRRARRRTGRRGVGPPAVRRIDARKLGEPSGTAVPRRVVLVQSIASYPTARHATTPPRRGAAATAPPVSASVVSGSTAPPRWARPPRSVGTTGPLTSPAWRCARIRDNRLQTPAVMVVPAPYGIHTPPFTVRRWLRALGPRSRPRCASTAGGRAPGPLGRSTVSLTSCGAGQEGRSPDRAVGGQRRRPAVLFRTAAGAVRALRPVTRMVCLARGRLLVLWATGAGQARRAPRGSSFRRARPPGRESPGTRCLP